MTTSGVAADDRIFAWNPRRNVLPPWFPRKLSIGKRVSNFGDVLASEVVEAMRRRVGSVGPRRLDDQRTLFSIGSVIHFARTNDVVWGSGINGKVTSTVYDTERLDVRAVRGPMTRARLEAAGQNVPSVFGDPALLLPQLFPEISDWARAKSATIVTVPNLNEIAAWHALPGHVDPRGPIWSVIKTIVQAETVVTSSLHGLIVAESFGVDVRLVQSGAEPAFKYQDYFAGTGREMPRPFQTPTEALHAGHPDHAPLDWDATALIDAFPAELWSDS